MQSPCTIYLPSSSTAKRFSKKKLSGSGDFALAIETVDIMHQMEITALIF